MTRYVLPDLPYDHGALEPHISGRIMELHHGRHHRAYVDNANKALEMLAEARASGDFDHIAALERMLAFNVSGHVLHSLFWQNMSPDGGGKPEGELADAIDRDFGGFDALRQQVNKAAAAIMGSGWVALVWDTVSAQLATVQIHDHQSNTIQGAVPLLVLDAWEHAYYLQYRNEKAKFFDAVWNVWNWQDVAARFEEARQFGLHLSGVAGRVPPGSPRAGAGRAGAQPSGRA